jgi:hypothetical protein
MPVDPDIAVLDLAPHAEHGAQQLRDEYPTITFTSGRRNRASQAKAMATNIVKSANRNWISETYVQSAARDSCQQWVDDNPDVEDIPGLTNGLRAVLDGLTDAQVGRLSKHLAGLAFDIAPVEDANGGADIKTFISGLQYLDKFIENEGGLTVWHLQFV